MEKFSAEKVQDIVEEKEAEYKKPEEEYSCLKEYYGELKSENDELQVRHERFKKEIAVLKREKNTLMKADATVLNFYREDCGKMEDLQELNNKLVKSCKKANRDFFILAAAYVATLMLMIYLFVR